MRVAHPQHVERRADGEGFRRPRPAVQVKPVRLAVDHPPDSVLDYLDLPHQLVVMLLVFHDEVLLSISHFLTSVEVRKWETRFRKSRPWMHAPPNNNPVPAPPSPFLCRNSLRNHPAERTLRFKGADRSSRNDAKPSSF